MKKIILSLMLLLTISVADEGAKGYEGYQVICLDGISYIKYYSTNNFPTQQGYFGLAIKLGKDSKVIPCVPPKVTTIHVKVGGL